MLIEQMIEDERERFSVCEYRGLPDAAPFELTEGSLPVLISAPHAISQLREGRIKPSDDFTGALALAAAHVAGCHAMVATRFDSCDPNWDPLESSAYKQALVEHVRSHRVRLVLDIHGVPSAAPNAIEVGSADGATVAVLPGLDEQVAVLLKDRLAPYLAKYDKSIALNGRYAARGENTVTRTVARECGIAALQLEVCSRFRVPADIGGHVPKGEKMPFTSDQLPIEVSARRNPDPDCVVAVIEAIAEIARIAVA